MSSPVTFLQAAEAVLRTHSPGSPLHYRRIAELALEDGLIQSKGLTPEATMGAQLYSDVKKRAAAGKPERFRQYGKGLFGLAAPTDPLGGAVSHHNHEVQDRLRHILSEMNPQAFEQLIGILLATIGFEDVEVTKYSGDGGVDVRATLTVGGVTDVKTAVQVKRWAANVTGRTVRELRGGLGPHERGLIITLSDFTPDAKNEAAAADRTPITLLSGDQLIAFLIDNEIGVTTRRLALIELDEASLFPGESDAPEELDGVSTTNVPPPANTYAGTKALSMWPMPGGRTTWKDALDGMLKYIAETAPTTQDAVNWVIEQYDKVLSPKVARGYFTSVLRPLDLIETQGEQIALTSTGAAYLEDPTRASLLAIARQNVAGFDEILEALDSGLKSTEAILDRLRTELGVSWQTDAQVRFRLLWLENLDQVAEVDGAWALAHVLPPSSAS